MASVHSAPLTRCTRNAPRSTAEEDKKMFGHLFDDKPPAGGSASEDEGSLLSSGEEEGEGDEEDADGWSDEESGSGSDEEAGGRGRGRRQPDELDEVFGQVCTLSRGVRFLYAVKLLRHYCTTAEHCC